MSDANANWMSSSRVSKVASWIQSETSNFVQRREYVAVNSICEIIWSPNTLSIKSSVEQSLTNCTSREVSRRLRCFPRRRALSSPRAEAPANDSAMVMQGMIIVCFLFRMIMVQKREELLRRILWGLLYLHYLKLFLFTSRSCRARPIILLAIKDPFRFLFRPCRGSIISKIHTCRAKWWTILSTFSLSTKPVSHILSNTMAMSHEWTHLPDEKDVI